MMGYITFTPFYSNRFPIWDRIGYFIHMIMIHVMFIVCPLVVIVHTAIYIKNIHESPAKGWFYTYAMMNVMVIIYYFAMFLKFV